MPPVFMMVFLLTLQWSLTAAVLCAAWRRDAARSALAARILATVPLLTLAAIASLLLADRVLIWSERAMMIVMACLTGCLWMFGFVRAERGQRVYQEAAWVGTAWMTLSTLLQGAFTLTCTWIALNNFLMASPYMIAVWRWMWLTLLAAPLSGALLSAAAFAGTLSPKEDSPASEGNNIGPIGIRPISPIPPADHLLRKISVLIGAVGLRVLALAGSLYLWAVFCPFGSHYFMGRLMDLSLNSMITLRVLLGVILPLLFALLALLKNQDGARNQAAVQFLPALLLVLISEMLAAALTAGMGGLAF